MKSIILLLMITMLTTTTVSFGNDSTLYKKRTIKITALIEWLKDRPYAKPGYLNGDTSLVGKQSDSAINLFFSKKIFTAKYDVKSTISRYHILLSRMPISDYFLEMPDMYRDTLIQFKEYPSYFKNTIIFYLRMYGEEFEGEYFEFAHNTDQLIYVIEAGGDNVEYKAKKVFLNSLN